jgi:hypothetical protein
MTRHDVDLARQRLLDARLVAHRPWRAGAATGSGSCSLCQHGRRRRVHRAVRAGDLLRQLGFGGSHNQTAE